MQNRLPLPRRLLALIEANLWPRTEEEERRQNIRSLVSRERVHLFAPNENRIYLFRPPFLTVAERMEGKGGRFWREYGALDGISPELTLDIGAFELGSDSAIVLDYRSEITSPAVLRLKWQAPRVTAWERCANTFDEFADMLGLEELSSSS